MTSLKLFYFVVVGSILLLVVVALIILCCRKFTLKRGHYRTKEARQTANNVATVDEALAAPNSDFPEARTSKEWWL